EQALRRRSGCRRCPRRHDRAAAPRALDHGTSGRRQLVDPQVAGSDPAQGARRARRRHRRRAPTARRGGEGKGRRAVSRKVHRARALAERAHGVHGAVDLLRGRPRTGPHGTVAMIQHASIVTGGLAVYLVYQEVRLVSDWLALALRFVEQGRFVDAGGVVTNAELAAGETVLLLERGAYSSEDYPRGTRWTGV